MNVIWSKYVQGVKTLYYSRKLRFHDMFRMQYEPLFDLDAKRNLKILEIGCGPGALAGSLHRWYPEAEITGIDRDSEFIRFAKENEPGISFIEGDAASLPFEDCEFDVTVSNTVSEHIEPTAFFSEQLRVLKPGGICLVLSSRKGINIAASCLTLSEAEKQFWESVAKYDDSFKKYSVCKYPMSESELPAAMEKYGFIDVHTGFTVVNLTPDNPIFSAQMAHDMINANRYSDLEAIDSVSKSLPEHFKDEKIEEMKRLANLRYDARIDLYDRGEKQWDTDVSVIMAVRGVKQR